MVKGKGVLTGPCGFAEAQERLFRQFGILEVQRTFYQPPMVSTAQRWRASAPPHFVFTLKAWQLITHEAGSPTYRRLTEHLSDKERARVGAFRWSAPVRKAWARTLAIAEALDAEAVVFQTPRSFEPTAEHLHQLSCFFERIDRQGRRMVFEPRGPAWNARVLRPLVEDLDLVHCVDPFLSQPVGRGLRYFRLHGRPAYHTRYAYSDEDLLALRERLNLAWPNRVLFNNDHMVEDARRFRDLIRDFK